MTAYHTVKVKLLDSQLNKFKSATENATSVTLRLLSYIIGTGENN